jgi:glycogen phosphorylase
VTGWSIGSPDGTRTAPEDYTNDAVSLYDKLEHVVAPLFYKNRPGFVDVMCNAIALNGSFF